MSMITPSNLQVLQTTFQNIFQTAYDGYVPWYDKVATVVPSSSKTNTYGWMQRIPTMRQWVGPRVLANIAASSYVLANLTYELTIAVQREDIEDDNLGVYSPLFAQLGQAAAQWPDVQLATMLALNTGTGPLGFDGVTFFNDSHPLAPSGVQDNKLAIALDPDNYGIARAAMSSFKGENDMPLGVTPNLLIVPPQLEQAARRILNAEFYPNSAGTAPVSNIWRNSADLLVVPQLASDPTRWYLFDTTKAIKPLVWQLRRPPMIVPMIKPDDPNVFWQKEYAYGVDARGNAGVATWWLGLTSKP